ncbi:MAG: tRNA-dihydrouridine synthase, partial [Clostridia bacterium]|nr:tRNA-dihydrouridine synthase [Clostridia bacterium]
GLRAKYEEHHGIAITDEAIEAAVKLSSRYINDRFLPDKAIDLVDEAAAGVRIVADGSNAELEEARKEVFRLEKERRRLEMMGDYASATEILREKIQTEEKIKALEQAHAPKHLADGRLAIGGEHVAAIVSARMRIPLMKITQAEGEKLMRLEQDLHRRIIGQNEAVNAVSKAIRRARAGLKDPSRPIGSFIFVGPTGVGKTDLCKALAEALFGSEEQCMDYAVKELEAEVAPEGFDINMGCPAPKIFNNGEGSALLRDLDKAERLVRTVRRATNLPVSVKMRLGVEIGEDVAVEAAKRFEAAGADFLAVHGRYREQHYSGKADWYKIAPVKQAVRIPVIANGDITCAEDFKSVLEITGADGIMVARGALGDPHLFTRLAAYRDSGVMLPPQTLEERLQTALRQLDLAIADKGEKPAVLEMRKHFLWYVRGVRGAAAYKNRCCKVTTRAECVALLNEIAENNK